MRVAEKIIIPGLDFKNATIIFRVAFVRRAWRMYVFLRFPHILGKPISSLDHGKNPFKKKSEKKMPTVLRKTVSNIHTIFTLWLCLSLVATMLMYVNLNRNKITNIIFSMPTIKKQQKPNQKQNKARSGCSNNNARTQKIDAHSM